MGELMSAGNGSPLFTREQVMAAVNDGSDLVTGDSRIDVSEAAEDLVNLIINAIGSRLDDPGVTLDEVITGNYETDYYCEDENCAHESCAIGIVLGWVNS